MAGSVKTRQQAKKAAVAAAEDEGLDPKQYYEKRLSALAAQKAAGVNPYPHKFEVELSIPEYVKRYGNLNSGDNVEDVEERIAGRLMNKRSSSSKLFLYDLHGDGAKVQVMADARNSDLDAEEFTQFHSLVKQGDIVGIIGFPGKSKKGELVIIPKTFKVLSHCLHMMPRQNGGPGSENAKNADVWVPGLPRNPETYTLKDQETRYMKRYLDLMLNSEVREIFKTRSKVISYIRHFLDERDFMEVEVPTMNTVARGDAAQPFITHHNDLNTKLYMRSAPELYLKELVVGGLNRVYEIGRRFGKGEIDSTHNTELTSAVCMAFADYNDLMKLTEDMLSGMVKELTGGYKIKYHANGLDNDPIEIDFTPPFRRIDMIDELEKTSSLSIPKDLSGARANKYLSDACMKFGIKCPPPQTTAQLLDELVGHFLEKTCTNPTFIINHPKILSSVAKWHRSKAGLTETFQLIINKNSVGDAYTALNDPLVLRQRLADQLKDRQSGGGEAMAPDETFCTALEYGVPPTSGWLLGIDRFTMLLTDSQDIKEVLPFPVMKPQDQPSNKERMPQSSPSLAPTTRESETADTAKELASSIIQIVQQYSKEQNAQARAREVVPRFLEYHPRKFRGREEPGAAEEWLRELERIFKHIAYTDEQRISCAVFQLVEDAYYWWESHTKTMSPEQIAGLTWEQFKQIVSRKYIPLSYLKGKEAEFHQLKQGSMTVTEYERLFHRLSRYASYLVDTDAESAQQFKQGLRPEIGCILPDSLTFAETVERAQKIESAAREQDNNGKRKWESVSPGYRASNQQQRRK